MATSHTVELKIVSYWCSIISIVVPLCTIQKTFIPIETESSFVHLLLYSIIITVIGSAVSE